MKSLLLCLTLFACAHEEAAPEAANPPTLEPKPAVECPVTLMVGWSGVELSETDLQNYKTAQKRCPEMYPDSPCVGVFMKVGDLQYQVLCGPQEGQLPKPEVEDPT